MLLRSIPNILRTSERQRNSSFIGQMMQRSISNPMGVSPKLRATVAGLGPCIA
jgi:hypothetical protein